MRGVHWFCVFYRLRQPQDLAKKAINTTTMVIDMAMKFIANKTTNRYVQTA